MEFIDKNSKDIKDHIILLKFSGPLQSFGTNSHFNKRNTDYYPSKSGVIGLIAACLGITRESYGLDLESDLAISGDNSKIPSLNLKTLGELSFAVRVEQHGVLTNDYHVAFTYRLERNSKNWHFRPKYKKDDTYLTDRSYLSDYVFLVGLYHSDAKIVEAIKQALAKPYFPPYLGRRSCPLNYDFIIQLDDFTDILSDATSNGVSPTSLYQIMVTFPWQASHWYKQDWYKKQKRQLQNGKLNSVSNSMSDATDTEDIIRYMTEIYLDSQIYNQLYQFRTNDAKLCSRLPESDIRPNIRTDNVVSFSRTGRKFESRLETRIPIDILIDSSHIMEHVQVAKDYKFKGVAKMQSINPNGQHDIMTAIPKS